jgi:hypothetical protein
MEFFLLLQIDVFFLLDIETRLFVAGPNFNRSIYKEVTLTLINQKGAQNEPLFQIFYDLFIF